MFAEENSPIKIATKECAQCRFKLKSRPKDRLIEQTSSKKLLYRATELSVPTVQPRFRHFPETTLDKLPPCRQDRFDVSNTVKMTQGINLKVTQIQPITFF